MDRDPERVREAVYAATLATVERFGRCREEGREPRAVLDAVFNVCMDDSAPFALGGRMPPSTQPFPPFPSEVDAADKGATMGSPPTMPAAEPPPRAKWGEA